MSIAIPFEDLPPKAQDLTSQLIRVQTEIVSHQMAHESWRSDSPAFIAIQELKRQRSNLQVELAWHGYAPTFKDAIVVVGAGRGQPLVTIHLLMQQGASA